MTGIAGAPRSMRDLLAGMRIVNRRAVLAALFGFAAAAALRRQPLLPHRPPPSR